MDCRFGKQRTAMTATDAHNNLEMTTAQIRVELTQVMTRLRVGKGKMFKIKTQLVADRKELHRLTTLMEASHARMP
jgi:hypothetical protein